MRYSLDEWLAIMTISDGAGGRKLKTTTSGGVDDVYSILTKSDNSGGRMVKVDSSGGGGTSITVVTNYSELPDPTTVEGQFYWCKESQGTWWLPGSLGGTYYPAGMYYSSGGNWTYMENPYQSTQDQVDAGLNDDTFVTPLTLRNSSQWGEYVPYTGATADVDLDTFGLNAKFLKIKGTGGNGKLTLKHQSSAATAAASESVIYADNSGNPAWKNDSSAVEAIVRGSGTNNEITAFNSTGSTITSLSTTTYPNLTELSYVKGVTSAIQTQLNGKQATLTNPVTGTGTNNEIAAFNSTGSTITSLTTATYPSLTELSYVKGVTSAIQTQINGKQATLVSGSNIKTIDGNSLLGSGDILTQSPISDTSAGTAVTGTTANTYSKGLLIAANSRTANNAPQADIRCAKTGTAGTMTLRIYWNTANNLTGAILLGLTAASGATARVFNIQRIMSIIVANGTGAGTEILNVATAANSDIGQNTSVNTTAAIDWTAAGYLICAVQNSSAADSTVCNFLKLH